MMWFILAVMFFFGIFDWVLIAATHEMPDTDDSWENHHPPDGSVMEA